MLFPFLLCIGNGLAACPARQQLCRGKRGPAQGWLIALFVLLSVHNAPEFRPPALARRAGFILRLALAGGQAILKRRGVILLLAGCRRPLGL